MLGDHESIGQKKGRRLKGRIKDKDRHRGVPPEGREP